MGYGCHLGRADHPRFYASVNMNPNDVSAAMRSRIEEALRADSEPRLATFDFDGTCIENDIGEATLGYMAEHRLNGVSPDTFERYYAAIDTGDIIEPYRACARILAGMTASDVSALVDAVLAAEGQLVGTRELWGRSILKGIRPRESTMRLITLLENSGVTVRIVSASAEPLVIAASRHFGLSCPVTGIRLAVENGAFTREIEVPTPISEGKVACIRQLMGEKRPLVGAGDSMNDLPMLEHCDIPVAVAPSKKLEAIARERGWNILVC